MDPRPILFVYDLVDPRSWALEAVLEALRSRWTGGSQGSSSPPSIRYLALEMNPPPGDLLLPTAGPWRDRWDEIVRSGPQPGCPPPAFVPWSRKALELVHHAESVDPEVGRRVRSGLFSSFFRDGLDLGRVDHLVRIALDHGLDYTETKAVLDVDKYGEAVAAQGREALELGAPGPGTLRLGDAWIEGWDGPGAMEDRLLEWRSNTP